MIAEALQVDCESLVQERHIIAATIQRTLRLQGDGTQTPEDRRCFGDVFGHTPCTFGGQNLGGGHAQFVQREARLRIDDGAGQARHKVGARQVESRTNGS